MTQEIRARAVQLITEIRGADLDDVMLSQAVVELSSLLPDPYFVAYTIDHEPELTPDEVVTKAFEYRTIQL